MATDLQRRMLAADRVQMAILFIEQTLVLNRHIRGRPALAEKAKKISGELAELHGMIWRGEEGGGDADGD